MPALPATALLRARPEDFDVTEVLGFEPSGEGEHVFLFLEKQTLNTQDLVQRIARASGVEARHIGFCGMKDRNAVTRQWMSVWMPGMAEPDWDVLESDGRVRVLQRTRHLRKLKRGVHRGNRFRLTLRAVTGDRAGLEAALERVRVAGAPNYFGEQRFGRDGSTLREARRAAERGQRLGRLKRQRCYSALRAYLFNEMLAQRVREGTWSTPQPGDVCVLQGTRSVFVCEVPDAAMQARATAGDVHPALPLWGVGGLRPDDITWQALQQAVAADAGLCHYLERAGLALAWRPTRLMPDDFCWQFCDDDSLQLTFALGAGSYATALLGEVVHCDVHQAVHNEEERHPSGSGSE